MIDDIIKIFVVALIGIVIADFVRGPRSLLIGFDRGMQASYEKVCVGDDKQNVMEALGEPYSRSEKFNLPQRKGFEHLFEAAENSSATEYLQWMNGGNWYYCIGFDPAGTVVIKGEGHS